MASLSPCRKPLGYEATNPLPARWKGKQIGTAAPRQGKTVDVYFEKKHNWIGEVSIGSSLPAALQGTHHLSILGTKDECLAGCQQQKMRETQQCLRLLVLPPEVFK